MGSFRIHPDAREGVSLKTSGTPESFDHVVSNTERDEITS